jgi:hypothetical protein
VDVEREAVEWIAAVVVEVALTEAVDVVLVVALAVDEEEVRVQRLLLARVSNVVNKDTCLVNVPPVVSRDQSPASNAANKATCPVNVPQRRKVPSAVSNVENRVICHESARKEVATNASSAARKDIKVVNVRQVVAAVEVHVVAAAEVLVVVVAVLVVASAVGEELALIARLAAQPRLSIRR